MGHVEFEDVQSAHDAFSLEVEVLKSLRHLVSLVRFGLARNSPPTPQGRDVHAARLDARRPDAPLLLFAK